MIQRDYLSWWLRPSFLQPWGKKQPILFAGPWLGEFGWELMNWQAFLRWLAPQYEKVIICCRPGMEALYSDFAHECLTHTVSCTSECNKALQINNPQELARVKALIPAHADYLPTVGWQPSSRKQFCPFGEKMPGLQYDIVFHPRGRGFGTDRNWEVEKWDALLEILKGKGLSIACIGMRNATLPVQGGYTDYRDAPLTQTMNILASSSLLIGPSSGPMHLGSLCGIPHLVWTDTKKYARGRTNRTKYEHWWNPLQTPAFVHDQEGFDPSVQAIADSILSILSSVAPNNP
jgi:hypothetical protein